MIADLIRGDSLVSMSWWKIGLRNLAMMGKTLAQADAKGLHYVRGRLAFAAHQAWSPPGRRRYRTRPVAASSCGRVLRRRDLFLSPQRRWRSRWVACTRLGPDHAQLKIEDVKNTLGRHLREQTEFLVKRALDEATPRRTRGSRPPRILTAKTAAQAKPQSYQRLIGGRAP